jgi:hypothetical protein
MLRATNQVVIRYLCSISCSGSSRAAPWIIPAAKLGFPSHLARPAPRKERARMDEARNIIRLNIERYKQLLATESDPHKLVTITRLLAEPEAGRQEMERKERSG